MVLRARADKGNSPLARNAARLRAPASGPDRSQVPASNGSTRQADPLARIHHYKPATLQRRIDRRVHQLRRTSIEEYMDILRDRPDEVSLLVGDTPRHEIAPAPVPSRTR